MPRRNKNPAKKSPVRQDQPQNSEAGLVSQDRRTALSLSTSYSGPLPPPSMLKAYDDVIPGAAERILALAERQAAHRQKIESTVVRGDTMRSWAGLIAGAFVAVLFLGVAALLVSTGHDLAGVAIGTTTLVSIVGTFIYGTESRRRERTTKYEDTTRRRLTR